MTVLLCLFRAQVGAVAQDNGRAHDCKFYVIALKLDKQALKLFAGFESFNITYSTLRDVLEG